MFNSPVSLTILHEIPGRIRLQLEKGFAGKYWEEITQKLGEMNDMAEIRCTDIVYTLLIHYNSVNIRREEILMRLGILFSGIDGPRAVRLYFPPEKEEFSDFAFYSGVMLFISLITRVFTKDPQVYKRLGWIASAGTVGAVLEHGYGEFKEQGYFDPEVLSLFYLLSTVGTDKLFPAALFTWGTTFARHLVNPNTESGMEMIPVASREAGRCGEIELEIEPIRKAPGKTTFLQVIPSLIYNFIGGIAGSPRPRSMAKDIKSFADRHNQLVKDLGKIYVSRQRTGNSDQYQGKV